MGISLLISILNQENKITGFYLKGIISLIEIKSSKILHPLLILENLSPMTLTLLERNNVF